MCSHAGEGRVAGTRSTVKVGAGAGPVQGLGCKFVGGKTQLSSLPSHPQCLAHSKCSLNTCGVSSFNLHSLMLYDKTNEHVKQKPDHGSPLIKPQ